MTDLAYDKRQRLITVTVKSNQGDAVTTFSYDPAGRLTGVTRPDGASLHYGYDAAGRLVSIENGLGERFEYVLDAAGNRVEETTRNTSGAITRTMTRVYDELSRLRLALGASGQSWGRDYDSKGNLIATEDGLGRVSSRAFDALDRLVLATDPALQDTSYGYDERDNLTELTAPGGVTTGYVYDGLGNLIQESSPDAGTTVHEYDAAGNVTRTTDGRGIVVEYSYDALNRVTAMTYPASPSENVTYTYDTGPNGIGRLQSVSDPGGTTTYSYDDRGNVLGESRNTGSATFAIAYTYDLADNVASITYPSGRTVTYTRDALGRISGASSQVPGGSSETLASAVVYQPFGPMASWTSGNGVSSIRAFDQDYRVTGIGISGSGLLHDLSYGYDVVDNIISIADQLNGIRSQSFGYDPLDRLSEADGAYGDQTYVYDANGNRNQRSNATTLETQTLTYAAGTNRLASVDGQSVVHDGAGNRISAEWNGSKRTKALAPGCPCDRKAIHSFSRLTSTEALMPPPVHLTRDGDIARITLSRPEKRNAISVETMESLISASAEVSRDDKVRAVIIDSTGEHFSVGADLSSQGPAADLSLLERRRITETGQRLMRALSEIRQPSIAAVHGVAAGAGACIASACDFRLGTSTSRIGYGEVRFGMTLMWHALPMCVHLVGASRARELLMTGQIKDAPTLLEWGFFNELAEDQSSLAALARTWAERLALLPPVPVQMIKRSIQAVSGALDAAIMHMDADQFLLCSGTEDARLAQRAFLEKTEATFSGR